MMDLPKINEKYNFFDDGKISWGRHYIAEVMDVIPYRRAPRKVKKWWKANVRSCPWVYATKTDYFIKTKIDGYSDDLIYFVRMKDGKHWFSIDIEKFWMSGLLDLDGSSMKSLEKYMPKPEDKPKMKELYGDVFR